MSTVEQSRRIVSERERLGLTVGQFAVLAGVSEAQQIAIESGDFSTSPYSYTHGAQRAGADPLFIIGQSTEPKIQRPNLLFGDDSFLSAVDLLRKSQQAVEAFIGEGASKNSPELVAAIMTATLQDRYSIGAGHFEDFADRIANAIEEAGSQIANALSPDDED